MQYDDGKARGRKPQLNAFEEGMANVREKTAKGRLVMHFEDMLKGSTGEGGLSGLQAFSHMVSDHVAAA